IDMNMEGRSDVDHVSPYRTLPDATSAYIQLRFHLARFKNVYRTVKIPLNYTFANLHTLIQYLFGWSDSHLHESKVYTHVQKYKDKKRIGEMKKYGHHTEYPEWILETSDPEREKYFWNLRTENAAYYCVEMSRGKKRGSGPGRKFMNEGVDFHKGFEDHELTLGMIWNIDKELNLSGGVCENTELGIAYQYDLASSWDVHVTFDTQEHFFTLDSPSNLPIIVQAVGAELSAEKKTLVPQFYDSSTFARYCEGKVYTYSDKEQLVIRDI
ncbi:hypothetical protein H0H93_011672, partial [Arthromyces matolae]